MSQTLSQNLSQTVVLLNPHAAGGKTAALADPLRQWLLLHAPRVGVLIPHSIAHAHLLLDALPQASRVVVVGGDGTLNQLLPRLLKGRHTIALVPFGSGNDTARALGLHGLSWKKALAHGLTGTASQIDLGLAEFDAEINGQEQACSIPFISSLTSGFDSSVGLRAINGPKWLRGLPRYLLATLRELANLRTWHIKVSLDGKIVYLGEALFASTLNTRTFGAGMPAVPHARMDDGKLDLLQAGHFKVFETLFMLPRMLIGKHLSHSKVQTLAYQNMVIDAKIPMPIAADGEYLGMSKRITLRVLPSALAVVAATV